MNIKIPENNSLKKEIKKLLELCEKNDEESGAEDSYFEEAIEEQKMTEWEAINGVVIPESYKEWLRFSRKCRIIRNTATFWGPDEFHSNYVPEGLVVIGEMVGDGTLVCFTKESKEFIEFFEGKISSKYNDFNAVIKEVLRMIGDTDEGKLTDEEIQIMLQKLAEIRKKREQGE